MDTTQHIGHVSNFKPGGLRRNPKTSHPPKKNKTHLFQYIEQLGTLYT